MNPTDGELAYEISEIYPVSQERLFKALTDATVLKKIWGVQEIAVDARAGGKTAAVFVIDGQDWSFTITYTEVVPNRRLKWITHFKSFPTKETRVTALFDEIATGTKLTVRMENFETSDERDANRQAWQHGLAALMDLVK
jgi:uncharacterized protein YndB with AHSA1/START domain